MLVDQPLYRGYSSLVLIFDHCGHRPAGRSGVTKPIAAATETPRTAINAIRTFHSGLFPFYVS
jgi:hypothetical protein